MGKGRQAVSNRAEQMGDGAIEAHGGGADGEKIDVIWWPVRQVDKGADKQNSKADKDLEPVCQAAASSRTFLHVVRQIEGELPTVKDLRPQWL